MNIPSRRRYLVSAANPGALAVVANGLRADPSVQLLDALGPQDAPHTLVVNMSDAQAEELRQRYAGSKDIHIERDQPLSPLSGGG